jgi:hypothetical protein
LPSNRVRQCETCEATYDSRSQHHCEMAGTAEPEDGVSRCTASGRAWNCKRPAIGPYGGVELCNSHMYQRAIRVPYKAGYLVPGLTKDEIGKGSGCRN